MAEGGDNERSSEDLGDEISQHRLEEYRRKGMVAQSRELTGLLALLAAGAAIYAFSPSMGRTMTGFMREVFTVNLSPRVDLGSSELPRRFLLRSIHVCILLGLPVCLAGFVMGVVGSFAQIGSIWSVEPLMPDFGKVDPLKGFQRLFSVKNALDGGRTTLKFAAVSLVTYALMKSEILRSSRFVAQAPGAILLSYGEVARIIFLSLLGILALFALMDFAMQKWEFNKQLRLTRQEARQEHKEREGDPQIKARIRAVQREVARRRMMQAVRTATVVVTNPTHFAVALYYEPGTTSAPKVVAKGADLLAQRIRKVAADSGVPCVENVPLARALYKTVKIGQQVPRALYQAVAEVLAYVYRLKGGRF